MLNHPVILGKTCFKIFIHSPFQNLVLETYAQLDKIKEQSILPLQMCPHKLQVAFPTFTALF